MESCIGAPKRLPPRDSTPSRNPALAESSDWARQIATVPVVTILGPLAGEPPEPMTKEQFETARKRLRATLNGVVTMDKRNLERLIDEVIWLKKRLQRVEHAVETLVENLRRGE